MKLDLVDIEVGWLQTELEGWIAGLQLVGLTLRRGLTEADRLAATGRHRFIADYLRAEVLAPLPDGLRRFLLRTSLLDRVCGSLGEAVTGQENGQTLLESLELIAAGLANREIAEQLVISPETAKKHAGNIYSKLGVHNRTQASAWVRFEPKLDGSSSD